MLAQNDNQRKHLLKFRDTIKANYSVYKFILNWKQSWPNYYPSDSDLKCLVKMQ